jgi:hypothetical protein
MTNQPVLDVHIARIVGDELLPPGAARLPPQSGLLNVFALSCSDQRPAPVGSDSLVTPPTCARKPEIEVMGWEGGTETIGLLAAPPPVDAPPSPSRSGWGCGGALEHGISVHSVLGNVVEKHPDLGFGFCAMVRRHDCRA